MNGSIERNISLYPLYRAAADAMAWLPIFFLYFSERLSLPQVLQLEAVYYIAVVLVEVPSGYLSDIAGRRRTLLLSCAALISAYLFFLFAESFTGLAVGQALLAISIAFRSGTDTALHYESLNAVNRADEYGDREAVAGKYGFAATAVAAIVGGVLGSIHLAIPYWFSLITACFATYFVFSFSEPTTAKRHSQDNFVTQIKSCFSYLRQPLLHWLFFYSIFMYAIVHIPYEFYQPYLALLENKNQLAGASATLIAGIIFAITALVASMSAAYSMTWTRRIGLLSLLTSASVITMIIIAAMAAVLHPLITLIVILRSGPMAVVTAPINAAMAPLIRDQHRATFLSIKSLFSRLIFSILLLGFSTVVSKTNDADWASLSILLRISLVLGVIALGILLWIAPRVKELHLKPSQDQTL